MRYPISGLPAKQKKLIKDVCCLLVQSIPNFPYDQLVVDEIGYWSEEKLLQYKQILIEQAEKIEELVKVELEKRGHKSNIHPWINYELRLHIAYNLLAKTAN